MLGFGCELYIHNCFLAIDNEFCTIPTVFSSGSLIGKSIYHSH